MLKNLEAVGHKATGIKAHAVLSYNRIAGIFRFLSLFSI